MSKRLKDKIALVSGAGSVGPGWGNGKATAVLFAREGAAVLCADINREAAEETRAIIRGEGGRAEAWECDVSQADQVKAMAAGCLEDYGRIDVLQNNVGILTVGGPVETTEEDWDRVHDVNLKSMFLTCKHVLPVMERQGSGTIVNISSIADLRHLGVPYLAYNTSKAAVSHLTRMVGAGFAGFAAGYIGQGPHDTDMMNIPDLGSLTVLPWRKNVAWLAGNIHVSGEAWPYCPRTILLRQLEKARLEGYTFNVGVEPEFMLLKESDSGRFEPWDRHDTLKKPCYDLRALHRNLDLMTTLIGYMQEMGWGPYANDHEDANCQFEINWHYSDALTTADRNTFFKWMVRTVAEENGLWATLMPKPFAHLTGNGTHYHMSLADVTSGENLFLDESDGLGLSQRARWFIAGILEHAGALAAVTSPIVNSYKRLIRSEPHSGATWAPVYVTYGPSNRTQMVRVPGPGRIENRTSDGASNPYLACAVALAAGLDGIERQLDPGTANNENLYTLTEAELKGRGIRFLPTSLNEALDCLEQDEVVKEALGETYAEYYIGVKREEWREYHRSVSQWELDNYLNVY